ncbi:MAG: cytochrome c [Gemmatimonadaceae bacterium]
MSADPMCRARRITSLAFASFALGACSWFTDFKEQPKHDPWESPNDTIPFRGNPQSSVSVYGTAAPGYAVSRTALPATIDSMSSIPNPIAADARSLVNGRKYYQINCSVCHGASGKGFAEAPITKFGIYAPPLASGTSLGHSDGYIWGVMRNGRGGMPSYNRIEELDRWDVVNYVRGLQGKYSVAIGPVGLPGETGDKVPGYSQMGPTRPSPYYIHAGSQAGMSDARVGQVTDSAAITPADSTRAVPVHAPAPASTPAPSGAARPQSPMTPSTGGVR